MLLHKLLYFVLYIVLYTNGPVTMFMIWDKNIQKSMFLMVYIQLGSMQRGGFLSLKIDNSSVMS